MLMMVKEFMRTVNYRKSEKTRTHKLGELSGSKEKS